MEFVKHVFIIINIVTSITGNKNRRRVEIEHPAVQTNLNYTGEKFPTQYLLPENTVATMSDLNRYLNNLQRSIEYFGQFLNASDCNLAFASYVTKSILKRTLRDYGSKLQGSHKNVITKVINEVENFVSHYSYRSRSHDWDDGDYKLSILLQNDDVLVHNIENFNRNRLTPWVLRNEYMNDFIEEIDEGTLPKEKFVKIVNDMPKYFIRIEDSDECITRIAYIREPVDVSRTQSCPPDDYCNIRISSEPSAAYALSHRMLNAYFRLKIRNCYIRSEKDDLKLIEKLCAFMYRETVYIARRGYFLRDLFLEHITLCGLMGYEEFLRLKWFDKAISWVNKYGCVKEFYNFEFNLTKLVRNEFETGISGENKYRTYRCEVLDSVCDDHPTALLLSVLAHAIRYTVHYMQP